MSTLWELLLAYLVGGITFIPLCLVSLFYLTTKSKRAVGASKEKAREHEDLFTPDPEFRVGELEELKGVEAFKKGWVYVTNKYYYHSSEIQGITGLEKDSLPTRDKMKRKRRFYAVLKHGNLFLYKGDAPTTDVFQVIVLKNSFVTMWPRNPEAEVSDASLFTNKSCISIWKNGKAYLDDSGHLQFLALSSLTQVDQYFVYVENNVDKEDWYFALINASKISTLDSGLDPTKSASTAHFKTTDMVSLIQTLNATEGQFSTKWLNTLVGRLFLSLQQTEMLNDYLKEKIHKKLTKINKPGFLDDFKIERLDVGNSAPMITNPKLLELAPEGRTKVRFNLLYKGNLNLIISTKANINLGSRFKNREVIIELSITVREIEGPLIILVKPPPSNRVWYAFESEPTLNIDIEPVVSTRQLSYNMITNVIKSKFKEALRESLVLPYMDDIVFYSTMGEIYRGGIWKHESTEPMESDDTIETSESSSNIPAPQYPSKTPSFTNTSAFAEKAPEPSKRKSVSPKQLPEDDPASIRKSNELHQFSDSDSIAERESISGLSENSLKTKTMHRVGTLKNMIKARTSTEGSVRSVESTSSVDSTGSKKYFQSGMKKIGKWYKDQVNNAREAVTESQLDMLHKYDVSPFISEHQKAIGPEMISNRRTHPRLKSQSDIKEDVKTTSESSSDMFVNRARATSFDTPKSTGLSAAYPFGPQTPITPVSPSSTISRRLSGSSQLEQPRSSEYLAHEEPRNNLTEILTQVPETKEFTKENKEADHQVPPAPDMATAAATAVFIAGPSSILVNGEQVGYKSLNRRRPLPAIPADSIELQTSDGLPSSKVISEGSSSDKGSDSS